MQNYDVIIIGAGAAGLMCAIEAGKRGRNTLILDKADKVGKKILISGGGRCNFTNIYTSPDNYISQNPHFCKSALSRYTPWDFIALLEKHGLSWTEKTLGQLFCDQKSGAVVQLLLDECQQAGVDIRLNKTIQKIEKLTSGFHIQTQQDTYHCHNLVIATGGPSIPAMGATDFAQEVAQQFSIKTLPFKAALVPFTFSAQEKEQFIQALSGISTPVELCSEAGICFKESILFTHRGISGPAALQISSYWQPGENITVNFFPDENATDWLLKQQQAHPHTALKTVLAYQLPKRLAVALVSLMGDDTYAKRSMKSFQVAELTHIANTLENWQLRPAGTEGMRTAEVSLGGIDTHELSSKTLASNKIEGLYFIGEAVDVTGHLGGYNFQWAWASGWCAGQYV